MAHKNNLSVISCNKMSTMCHWTNLVLDNLAFLFAVFRSRPSPFYVMDEVEAALDDVNLHRFLTLVDEFRKDAQLLIVSHQKRTMEAGDCLLGVTMQPGGSSRVIVERAATTSA